MIPREPKGSNLKYLMLLQIEIENTNILFEWGKLNVLITGIKKQI